MSVDFLVFEPGEAPRELKDFERWFEQVTEWDLSTDINETPSTSSATLQSWYRDILPSYPAANGPDAAAHDDENPRLMEYSFAPVAIYAGLHWSEADEAFAIAKRLAAKHGLGFFDPQSDMRKVIFPDGTKLTDSRSWLTRLFGG